MSALYSQALLGSKGVLYETLKIAIVALTSKEVECLKLTDPEQYYDYLC